ncbi:MAG: DUF3450 domain-containing protein [Desulfobacteraceae bacterium]|nr:DUF3450 domain-containing protein [Desulfobacteraceae bacterium]
MKTKYIFLFLIFLQSCVTFAFSETRPADLQKKMENTIRQGQASQAQADAWAKQREAYLDEIRELKNRKRWLEHQHGKYQTYIQKQQEAIAELERRKKEAEKINMALEPFLDELMIRLETFVEKDIPFLPEERRKRLGHLRDTLNSYHVGLAEKTQRIFEALQVEAGYGGSVEKTEDTIELEKGRVHVNLLRIGRTAFFYQTPDGKQSGWFNREKNGWQPLPDSYTRELTRAMEIAEKKRTPVLLDIPVGRLKK